MFVLFTVDAEVVLSLNSRDLRDLFLPFHLVGVDETVLPVSEALDILQLDLEASLTPIEQRVCTIFVELWCSSLLPLICFLIIRDFACYFIDNCAMLCSYYVRNSV